MRWLLKLKEDETDYYLQAHFFCKRKKNFISNKNFQENFLQLILKLIILIIKKKKNWI